MGLFRKRHQQTQSGPKAIEVTLVTGTEPLDVVGESHRQDALWTIVGGHTTEYVRHDVIAILIPEAANAYDSNAISVWVDGLQVGFLSRQDAAKYRPGLVALWQKGGHPVGLHGQVVGGGRRDDGSIGYLGVFLQHDPVEFGLKPRHGPGNGHVRTGRSEAPALGAVLDNLPSDDVAAIKALRVLLEHEQDPVVRHFAYAELERRLYHCRDVFASALDEFDATCDAHHNDMSAIRPALVAGFGGVPLLELYRQACIRKQKEHDWDAVISWASRGLTVYGDDAIDPDHVNDLRQRKAHAEAKLNPVARVSRPAEPAVHEAVLEELTCRRCAQVFAREVARGRKPSLCPECRTFDSP